MQVVQMTPVVSYGNAIGNDILALNSILVKNGYSTDIYVESISMDPRLPQGLVKHIDEYVDCSEDIILFHFSIGTSLIEKVKEFKAKIVAIYHNVTPSHFWKTYDQHMEHACASAIENAKRLADITDFCLADSEYNKNDLRKLGFNCPIEVLPVLIAFEDYSAEPNESILKRYDSDGYTNILFTGRIAPNKKQEDIILAFYYYKNYINLKSRLFLVGDYGEWDIYGRKLKDYVQCLGLWDVYFTGHVSFNEMLAYYRIADVFLCLSEHEGFCVPLVEAMYFGVPIIAYDSSAVGETLGGSGLLLAEKDPKIVAEVIHKVVSDEDIRTKMIYNEKLRLKDFAGEKVGRDFLTILSKIVG